MKVLLFEDDDVLRLIIESFLGVLGHQVTSCRNISEVMVAMQSDRYQLLISDWDVGKRFTDEIVNLLPEEVPVLILTRNMEEVPEDHPFRKRSGRLRVMDDREGLLGIKKRMRELMPLEQWQ